jgi:hypothetical protein
VCHERGPYFFTNECSLSTYSFESDGKSTFFVAFPALKPEADWTAVEI